MTEIILLGSGDTLGVPLAGCKTPACLDTDPRSKRFRFGLLIKHRDKTVLIDTNPDIKWQCINSGFELKEVDDIFITHAHSDHLNGMGEFFYRRETPTDVYYLNNDLTRKNISYFFYLENEEVLRFQEYENHQEYKIGKNIIVTPFELNHGFPCSGFVIKIGEKKIVIAPDTNLKLSQQSLELTNDCDYLFADVFSEDMSQVAALASEGNIDLGGEEIEDNWYHMTLEEAKELQKKTKAKIMITIHMSRCLPPHEEMVRKYQTDSLIIGYDNLHIEL